MDAAQDLNTWPLAELWILMKRQAPRDSVGLDRQVDSSASIIGQRMSQQTLHSQTIKRRRTLPCRFAPFYAGCTVLPHCGLAAPLIQGAD